MVQTSSGVSLGTAPRLSILIPVYNERRTILPLIEKVRRVGVPIDKEILIGDDGSTDGTRELLERVRDEPGVHIELMPRNAGRGAVIKHLWRRMTGTVAVHQDADLEYDPSEYGSMLEPILSGQADVVYGSRFRGSIERMRFANNAGNRLMTMMCRWLYGVRLSDLMTCYKMYRVELIRGIEIRADRFDFEAELTARLAQCGARFAEVPISFTGRTVEEGKKIRARDALFVTQRLLSCKWSGSGLASRRA